MVLGTIANGLNNTQFGLFGQLSTFIEPLFGIIDAHPDESHSITVSKTDYPIETGSSLTDNAVNEPDKLTLEGWVSDLLIPTNALVQIEGRPIEAWERIRALAKAREPLTVVTSLQTYENMLITSVSSVKNKDTGQTLRFIIELEETLFAETQLARLPPTRVDPEGPAAAKTSEVDRGQIQSPVLTSSQTTQVYSGLAPDLTIQEQLEQERRANRPDSPLFIN